MSYHGQRDGILGESPIWKDKGEFIIATSFSVLCFGEVWVSSILSDLASMPTVTGRETPDKSKIAVQTPTTWFIGTLSRELQGSLAWLLGQGVGAARRSANNIHFREILWLIIEYVIPSFSGILNWLSYKLELDPQVKHRLLDWSLWLWPRASKKASHETGITQKVVPVVCLYVADIC